MSTMQTKHGLRWLVIAAAATVVMPASIVSAAGTSPFSTAVMALPGLEMYSQFDELDVDLDIAGLGCCVGYTNSAGGGWLGVQGGAAFAPGDAASGPGAPLAGVVGDVNLSQQNRPGSGPATAAMGTLYTALVFRGQPVTGSETAIYGGAWVSTNGLDRGSIDLVVMGQDETAGSGVGTGLDNNSPNTSLASWHLFSRDDDGAAGGSGKLSWQIGDGTNLVNFESSVNVNDTDYSFVAFSYNGNAADPNALSLFVNGSPVPTVRSVTGSDAALGYLDGAYQLSVGNAFGYYNIWDGPMDEVFFGFGELSALQVANLWDLADAPAPGLDGDYNDDDVVDAADYVVWRKDPASFGGDPEGYNTWRANFGATASGSGAALGSTSIPEPATWILAAFAAIRVFWTKRRR